MDKWLKVVCLVALLVVAGSAAALPPQCEESCTCARKCTTLCAVGGWVTNCGAYGECIGSSGCRSADVDTASAQPTAESDAADPLLEQILGQRAACDTPSTATQAIASAD